MPKTLSHYIPVCDAIARLFQPHVEVVLHDLHTGKIAHISNAYSKRKVGDSSLIDEEPEFEKDAHVIGPYPKSRWDGHRLKSITAVLRDEKDCAIGLLCINYDVQGFSDALQQLQHLVGIPALVEPSRALLSKDWKEAVNTSVNMYLTKHNTTLAGLTSRDVDELLKELRVKGVFEIRNAVPYVSEILRLSRATIYNRLRAGQSNAHRKRGLNRTGKKKS